MNNYNNNYDLIRQQTEKVESLLNEFYSDKSSNERKRQIETELHIFNELGIYFDFIVYNLDDINNRLLWFFKISCLEVSRNF